MSQKSFCAGFFDDALYLSNIKNSKAAGGFTLIECIISLLALSIVFLCALQAINIAVTSGAYAQNAHQGGALLEGIIANARTAANPDIAEKTDLWELIKKPEQADNYDITLIFTNIQTEESYLFTNNGINLLTGDVSYDFTSAAFGASYDLIIDADVSSWTISDDITGSFHILATVPEGNVLNIINNGDAEVFADICGSGDVYYEGGGIFIEARVCEDAPLFIITGAIASRGGNFISVMTAIE